MNIDITNAGTVSGFYAVPFDAYADILAESAITFRQDLGGVSISHGTRHGQPIWLLDNPAGLYGVWIEEPRDGLAH